MFYLFWELDTDKDGKLGIEDLLGFEGLSDVFVRDYWFRRKSKFIDYSEFVRFCLSFHDLTRPQSLVYMCSFLDICQNGKVRRRELETIYADLVRNSAERLPDFADIVSQFWEPLNPIIDGSDWFLRIEDLVDPSRASLVGAFLGIVLSKDKLIAFEQRDPYSERQERLERPRWTDWDRFCHKEYCRIMHSVH